MAKTGLLETGNGARGTLRPIRAVRFVCLLACAAVALADGAERTPPSKSTSTVELVRQLEAHTGAPRFVSATWGVQVVSLDSGDVLYEKNPHALLIPASCAKLFTSALALDRLGPAYRIRTSLMAEKPPTNGIINGPLVVYGRGDPSFSAKFHPNGDPLAPLVTALVEAGIREVTGDWIGDVSYFNSSRHGSGWAWDDLQYYYGAEASPLSVDDNTLDFELRPSVNQGEPCIVQPLQPVSPVGFINATRTSEPGTLAWIRVQRPLGSSVARVTGQLPLNREPWLENVSVPDPAQWFVARLRQRCLDMGIRAPGRVRLAGTGSQLPLVSDPSDRKGVPRATASDRRCDETPMIEVAGCDSPPLSEIVEVMMKRSQNLSAQLLFLQVGAHLAARNEAAAADSPAEGLFSEAPVSTEAWARRALDVFVADAGIAASEVLLEEGAGLSRGSLLSAHAMVQLLRFMDRHPARESFHQSLPVAGVDGTLRRRMIGTSAERTVRAKTGSMRYVSSLAGYAHSASGERLAFAVLLNGYLPVAGFSAQQDVDRVAVLLSEYETR